MKNNFSSMILAAGFGKRMMPLTKESPKSLIDINGITLLDNSINFLKKIGCDEIIINTHYKFTKINEHIKKKKYNCNIRLVHEPEILDTGGAIKNAIDLFNNKNIIIINSDIFWRNKNIKDVKNLITKYNLNKKPHLLLVDKINTNGLNKEFGDFVLDKNKVLRFKEGDPIFFYSGLQIINLDIFKTFLSKKFSINIVWDYLISREMLFGEIMRTNWYHVGDMQGLDIARKLNP